MDISLFCSVEDVKNATSEDVLLSLNADDAKIIKAIEYASGIIKGYVRTNNVKANATLNHCCVAIAINYLWYCSNPDGGRIPEHIMVGYEQAIYTLKEYKKNNLVQDDIDSKKDTPPFYSYQDKDQYSENLLLNF